MKAEIKLCLGDSVRHVFRSLIAEASQPSPEKGRATISLEGDCVVISIESNTISGLRALTNSFLLLAYASYSSLKTIS